MLPAERIVLVLVEPQDPVNVGGVIRVMLNFGLSELRLVRPASGTVDLARLDEVAHRSHDITRRVQTVDTLAQALAGVSYVAGTTARPRAQPGPVSTPRAAAPYLIQQTDVGRLALVFGPENTGLSNRDLDLCHLVLTIPTAPAYRSLNLAQAALLVCYELWLESQTPDQPEAVDAADQTPDRGSGDGRASVRGVPAPVGDLEDLFAESTRALYGIGFLKPGQEAVIMRRLRGMVHRALPNANEVALLRAITREINKYVERQSS